MTDAVMTRRRFAGIAHQFARPDEGPLTADAFSGGEATVAAKLRELGFVVSGEGDGASASGTTWKVPMQAWIFQGNPDEFDLDGYLASRPGQVTWLVRRYASEIAVGDHVYVWRNQGSQRAVAGVVAEGIVTAAPAMRDEDPAAVPFWRTQAPQAGAPQMRTLIRLVKVASSREVLRGDWFEEDPILHDLPNLRMRTATNYKISSEHARRLDALWSRTGRDWIRNESVAGLWAYAETYGHPVSRLPGSPVAHVALVIGRAVSGVYAKVMNFRSLDPRAEGVL
jgi:hypothetical protein